MGFYIVFGTIGLLALVLGIIVLYQDRREKHLSKGN